jgi:hypothetical protein
VDGVVQGVWIQSIMLKVRSSVPGSNNKSCMYYYCSYILSVLTDVPELITVLGSTPTLLCTRFMLIENNTVLSSILYCKSSPHIHVLPHLCRPQGPRVSIRSVQPFRGREGATEVEPRARFFWSPVATHSPGKYRE